MAYDEILAERIEEILSALPNLTSKKMFGGLCFLVGGNMLCGVEKNRLMLRVGPTHYDETLALPHASEMDFTGRPMRGFVMIGEQGLETDEQLKSWLFKALAFVEGLPPKEKKK